MLQAQRMPHLMHRCHEKRFVIAGAGREPQISVQVNRRALNRHELSGSRVHWSRERARPAIAKQPGRQILEDNIATRSVLQSRGIFQPAKGHPQV